MNPVPRDDWSSRVSASLNVPVTTRHMHYATRSRRPSIDAHTLRMPAAEKVPMPFGTELRKSAVASL